MQRLWQPRPRDQVVRRPRLAEAQPIRIPVEPRRVFRLHLLSPWFPLLGLLSLVLVGFLLLLLPWSSREEGITPWSVALFTATSAVTVTGLVVRDTAEYWTPLGKGILAFLIFVGGTGFMTLGAFLLSILRQRTSLSFQVLLQEPLGRPHLGQVARMARQVVATFLLIQAVGALLLWALVYRPLFPEDLGAQVGYTLFHAISAFNNAGFTIHPQSESLSALAQAPLALLLFGLLIILGGVGYPVLEDLRFHRWHFYRYSVDTKIVLVASLALWTLGAVVILASEMGKVTTLGAMPLEDRIANALFLSVSARTAGFSTFPLERVAQGTLFLIVGLMFVGTASVSTGGGIRLNTLGVLVAAAWAGIQGRSQVQVFRRTLPPEVVHRAVAVSLLSLLLVFAMAMLIAMWERAQVQFLRILFAVVSAFGTVGLSVGPIQDLKVASQFVLMVAMVLGRVGPLTLALGLARMRGLAPQPSYRYAEERVRIG